MICSNPVLDQLEEIIRFRHNHFGLCMSCDRVSRNCGALCAVTLGFYDEDACSGSNLATQFNTEFNGFSGFFSVNLTSGGPRSRVRLP